jgi:hypothetical protein
MLRAHLRPVLLSRITSPVAVRFGGQLWSGRPESPELLPLVLPLLLPELLPLDVLLPLVLPLPPEVPPLLLVPLLLPLLPLLLVPLPLLPLLMVPLLLPLPPAPPSPDPPPLVPHAKETAATTTGTKVPNHVCRCRDRPQVACFIACPPRGHRRREPVGARSLRSAPLY